MNEGQESLYELLEEVDKICRDNGIVYYVGGGAALGAIRGGGFMPWDDDIDLHITRDNWKKLINAMSTQLPADREFVCTEINDMYGNPLGRYVDKRSTLMSKSQLMTAKACGPLIEFFVFDPMPKSPEGKARHKMLVKTYCELLTPYKVANINVLYENPEFNYENYSYYLKRAEKEGLNNILDELFEEITSVPEEESDAWYMVWATKNHQYPKEMFGTPRYVKFERGMFPVAAMQEHVDRLAYGNSWMYVPHAEGQIVHETTDEEPGIPYQEIVDMYMPLLDKEKLYNAFLSRKRIKVGTLRTWGIYRKEREILWFDVVGRPIMDKCNSSAKDLRAALDRGDYKTVGEVVGDFMHVQNRQFVKVSGLLMPVSDEFLSVVFDYNIRMGRYYAISRMVRVRRDKGGDIPDALQASFDEFDYCRALSVAVYDDRDPDKAEDLIKEHPEYEERLDTIRSELWIMSKRACSEDDWHTLLDAATAAEQKYPFDGELMRFTALALYSLGKTEEAKEKYTEAVKNTRNGFVWREAEENVGVDAYDLVGDEEAGTGDLDNMEYRMKHLKELLFEIDDICRANDLKYSITHKFANTMEEENTLPDRFTTVCIAMTLGDLERLEHIVNDEGDGSRFVENIHNNPKADNLAARYVDTETTFVDFEEYDRHTYHGLYVDIRPIKQYDPANMKRRAYDFYKGLWTDAVRDKDKKKSGLKALGLKAARKIMGERDIAERYYQADREVSMVDSWEDIEKAPAIKCGAFSIRKKSYYNTSRFKAFNLERNWKVEDRMADGHPVMYCNQFYGRHLRGGVRGTEWALDNQMVSLEPFSELLTGDVEKQLYRVRDIRDQYYTTTAPVKEYGKTISSAWNIYLMAKDLLVYERQAGEDLYEQVRDALDKKDKERFVGLLEDYFLFLITWRTEGCPMVQIPELRQAILDAVDVFYPGKMIPKSALEANDIDNKILTQNFPYLDEQSQMARLIKAAITGEWDLIPREDRKEKETPFVKSEIRQKAMQKIEG